MPTKSTQKKINNNNNPEDRTPTVHFEAALVDVQQKTKLQKQGVGVEHK